MVDEPPGSRDASGRLGNKSKGDPQSSQSSETGHVQITDSARNLGAGTLVLGLYHEALWYCRACCC